MESPHAKEIELFGETFDLELDAGCLRLAQMEGKGIEPSALSEMEDFTLGAKLAYIALLPQLPNGKTEEEVVRALVESGMSTEAAQHCLGQYLDMQNELGKFLQEKVETMQSVTDS